MKGNSTALFKHILPEDYPDIATSMSNIASECSHLGIYNRALETKEVALSMYCVLCTDEDYPDIARSMSNLALIYTALKIGDSSRPRR